MAPQKVLDCPMSVSYQMIGCSTLQGKILDVRIKARGDCLFVFFFFSPTTAPFPSRSGACYFCAACFRDLRSLLSESLAQADQMTFPKLENGDNTAKEKKAITHNHYYWCWLFVKNSYLAQKKLSLRASDYWIGRSNSQLRETRRIEFFV